MFSSTTLRAAGVVVATSLAVACGSDPVASACQQVSGTLTAQSVPQFAGEALTGFAVIGTASTGPLAGDISADLLITHFDEAGTAHFTGAHRLMNTSLGSFVTSDEGFTTATGGIQNRLTVVQGGSGELTTEGSVDLETGIVNLQYQGDVCAGG